MEKKGHIIRFRVTDSELRSIKQINPGVDNFSDLLRSVVLKEAKSNVSEEQRRLKSLNNRLFDLNEKIFALETEKVVVEGLVLDAARKLKVVESSD